MAEPVGVDRARGSAKQSSASGRSQIRSYSYGSGARRFDPGAWPSSRPRLVVAIVGRPCVGARAIRIAKGEPCPGEAKSADLDVSRFAPFQE